jgi:hypothetical protein
MRNGMNLLIVAGEVLLFSLVVTALAAAAQPVVLHPGPASASSPFAAAQPVRVTMTNQHGQVTTLEYREPIRIVAARAEEPLPSINELPVVRLPARDDDLVSLRPVTQASYAPASYDAASHAATPPASYAVHQAHYAPAASVAPSLVYTQHSTPGATVLPPPTRYTVPNFQTPVTGAPHTVFYPVAPVTPVMQSNVQVGRGIYGQPIIYRPGQPLRNALRWLTP